MSKGASAALEAFRRRPVLVLFFGLGAVAILVMVLFVLPPLMTTPAGSISAAERLKSENDIRSTLIQALGGAVLLVGLYFTARTLEINRSGQLTDRFSRAIDQLGKKDSLDVRLGGIYSLERIARDSDEDREPVVEVLTAFLRENTPPNYQPPPHVLQAYRKVKRSIDKQVDERAPADLQAAATVLARRSFYRAERRSLNLRGVALSYAELAGAHLERADLFGAHLERANLNGAHLEGADLEGAHLEGARLVGAHMERAHLLDAHLNGADLTGADLHNAVAVYAHFEGAMLRNAQLDQADLRGANLKAHGLSAHQFASAQLSESTGRPDGPPGH